MLSDAAIKNAKPQPDKGSKPKPRKVADALGLTAPPPGGASAMGDTAATTLSANWVARIRSGASWEVP